MRKVSCKAKPRDRGKLPLVILEKKLDHLSIVVEQIFFI